MFQKRINDVITGNLDLENIFTFENFPVLMTCTEQDKSLDVLANLDFAISKSSGMIQGTNLADLDFLYGNAHVSGVIGNIWKEHHKCFAEFIYKYKRKNIIEIGGQHGILYDNYINFTDDVKWTMIDPDPSENTNPEINIIKGFFDEDTIIPDEVDCIVHSHFFEHLYEPNKFLKKISSVLNEKMMIFSTPNLREWFENNYSQTLTFEHTYLFNEYYIEKLLNKNNLEIVEMKYFLKEHSIFYAVRFNPNLSLTQELDLYIDNKKAFENFVNYKKNIVKNINNFTCKKPIFIFGAHVNTQFLVNLGLQTENIICLLDNSEFKQSKRLYGTSLYVKNPNILSGIEKPVVVVDTGKYNEEIIKSLLEKYQHIEALSLDSFNY